VDPGRVLRNDFLSLLLRPDEQDDAAATAEPLDEGVGLLEPGQRSLEVDDVDPRTLPEEVPLHLRVPPSRLVAEMHARLEELPPSDDRHGVLLSVVSSARIDPMAARRACGTPACGPRACVLDAKARRRRDPTSDDATLSRAGRSAASARRPRSRRSPGSGRRTSRRLPSAAR